MNLNAIFRNEIPGINKPPSKTGHGDDGSCHNNLSSVGADYGENVLVAQLDKFIRPDRFVINQKSSPAWPRLADIQLIVRYAVPIKPSHQRFCGLCSDQSEITVERVHIPGRCKNDIEAILTILEELLNHFCGRPHVLIRLFGQLFLADSAIDIKYNAAFAMNYRAPSISTIRR